MVKLLNDISTKFLNQIDLSTFQPFNFLTLN